MHHNKVALYAIFLIEMGKKKIKSQSSEVSFKVNLPDPARGARNCAAHEDACFKDNFNHELFT